ncbi:hypothetical protein Sango_2306500 [Sesamum angolense]|uniref:Reverse transcriptase zinc-binding domain-containing protein n=1 Tax=Sesamum angolense TaxID=2727404 RepID=A0AAE1WAB7_9LAMI|nr:hypothetical protein Sango_2306500 [Sesamum angolense]
MRAVIDFFRSERMLRQLNHTIIALVPKSEHSPSVADYRPISCYNVIYKVITNIIADCLPPTLEHLTDSSQATFVGAETSQTIFSWLKKWDVSSHAVNTFKSNIFTADIRNDVLDRILARTEFARGDMPVQYLGIPLTAKRFSTTAYSLSCGPDCRQTRYGLNGSMRSTSDGLQFGIGSRRRVTLHSFDDLPTYESELSLLLALQTQQFSVWRSGPTLRLWERLATRDRLAFLQEESSCLLCINNNESAEHLFFECPFSDYVWSHIRQWLGITHRMSTILSEVKWLKKGKTGSSV